MSKINERLKPIFKEYLPKNASVTIHNRLTKKGHDYSISYIQHCLQLGKPKVNNTIIAEAVELCDEILDNKLKLIEKYEKVNA